jgi:hypothetical protein
MQFLYDGPNLPRKLRERRQRGRAGATALGPSIEERTQELSAEHASAIERRDPQGAIDALMAIAELHGLLVDRVEVTAVPRLGKLEE